MTTPFEMPRTASVVGLGRIGAPLAACLAVRGLEVVGVDVDPAKVAALNGGRAPVVEAGLDELVARHRGSLRATADLRDAVLATDVTFLALPTGAADDGTLVVPALVPLCRALGEALREKDGAHLVAVVSTVMPGTTAAAAAEIVAAAGAHGRVDVCFAPEFVALGTAIRDFLQPAFALIGAPDRVAGDRLEAVLRRVWENEPPVVRATLEEAELAKLALNAFLATKVSFANVLAELCETLPGSDVDVVSTAVGLDPRVGRSFLTGAVGFGGPCLPRDTAALAALARARGASSDLADGALAVNERTLERLLALVEDRLPAGGTVGICGLAFKPGTGVVEASPGVELARRLAERGARVTAFDPLVNGADGLGIPLARSVEECVSAADVVVVATPSNEFAALGEGGGRTVIDCWRILEPEALADADYVPIGRGPR